MSTYNNPLLPKARRERVATYNMTAEQLEQLTRDAQREGYTEAIYICNAMYTAAMLTSLRECLGFGQRRLKYIHDKVQKNFEALRDGEISYQDVAQALMDECRINLVIERPDGLRRIYRTYSRQWASSRGISCGSGREVRVMANNDLISRQAIRRKDRKCG